MDSKNLSLYKTTLFGEGLERVAVRPITGNIYWLTHCLGDLAQDYYAEYFSLLPNAADYAGQRVVDYPFSAFLIVDEKSMLIDTIAPRQQAAVAQLFQQYDVQIFAPSHGNVIRKDVSHYIPLLQEGMRRAAAMAYSHHF